MRKKLPWTIYFNPRSREGSDGQSVSAESIHIAISIHAPARGATRYSCPTGSSSTHFNPRSREGSDAKAHPEWINTENFNPRSREGSDEGDGAMFEVYVIFQSTLPRGERRDSVAGTYTQ